MEIYMNIDMYDNICKELNSNWCFLKFIFFVKNSHILLFSNQYVLLNLRSGFMKSN